MNTNNLMYILNLKESSASFLFWKIFSLEKRDKKMYHKTLFQNTPFGVTSDKDDADISTNDILYVDRPELLARFEKGDRIKFW